MFEIDVKNMFPAFLRNDTKGRAMCAAVAAAMSKLDGIVSDGIKTTLDPDYMPEWRLDEMAEEYGIVYDYSASVDKKRNWIKNATPLFALYGTPQSIYNFLSGYFGKIEIEESWQYGGLPHHFRVTTEGEWTEAAEAWARMAIEATKAVRSVFDSIEPGGNATIAVHGEGGAIGSAWIPRTGTDRLTGTWPHWIHDETGE